jgi:hypothetical protein
MAAEHAAIGMQLVDDDIPQILEELGPTRVMRKDARMHHVGIAEDEVRTRADRPPGVLRRIAVVREHADLGGRPLLERFAHRLQFSELILGERLRREEVQRPARGILENRVKNRSVVAERLAGRRRRGHDDVSAPERMLDRGRLVCVWRRDPTRGQGLAEPAVERLWKRGVLSGDCGQPADGRHVQIGRVRPIRSPAGHEPFEGGIERPIASGTCCQHSGSRQADVRHGCPS